jgi:hypothetical protein
MFAAIRVDLEQSHSREMGRKVQKLRRLLVPKKWCCLQTANEVLNDSGEEPVCVLKKREKFCGSENPNS